MQKAGSLFEDRRARRRRPAQDLRPLHRRAGWCRQQAHHGARGPLWSPSPLTPM